MKSKMYAIQLGDVVEVSEYATLKKVVDKMRRTVLILTIKKKWFREIQLEKKKEEYRSQTGYWINRLDKEYDYVLFRNGYQKDSPALLVEYKGLKEKEVDIEI